MFTLPVLGRLTEARLLAPLNIPCIFVTLLVSGRLIVVKLLAPENMYLILVTFLVSQVLKSWLKVVLP